MNTARETSVSGVKIFAIGERNPSDEISKNEICDERGSKKPAHNFVRFFSQSRKGSEPANTYELESLSRTCGIQELSILGGAMKSIRDTGLGGAHVCDGAFFAVPVFNRLVRK